MLTPTGWESFDLKRLSDYRKRIGKIRIREKNLVLQILKENCLTLIDTFTDFLKTGETEYNMHTLDEWDSTIKTFYGCSYIALVDDCLELIYDFRRKLQIIYK